MDSLLAALSVTPVTLAAAAILSVLIFLHFQWKHKDVPPGPRGLPLFGYAPFFGPNPQDTFLELGKKYGDLFSLYMGPEFAVVLNSYEAIKAAFVNQADIFLGRPNGFVFNEISRGDDGVIHGITLAEGEEWKGSRRFMLQTFRDLGMGKTRIQDRILEEAQYLCESFSKEVGKPFDPALSFNLCTSNVVCVLCFGKRFEINDPMFRKLTSDTVSTSEFLAQAGPLQSFPFLRFIPGPFRRKWKNFMRISSENWQFTRSMIKDHIATYDPDETRDYIDAFLHQRNKLISSGKTPEDNWFAEDDLVMNLRAFHGAGTETTAATLYWALLYMITFPEIQRKAQEQIDQSIGRDKPVRIEDREKVPYVDAICREVQRLANTTPFGVLRSNIKETTLMGYRIPKRSFIMPNFLAVNMDPKLWPNPTEFRPERFLDGSGKLVEPPWFMPFSTGKRACVGESLARMELFLFFANMLQKFSFKAPKDHPAPPVQEHYTGISCRPRSFKVLISERQ